MVELQTRYDIEQPLARIGGRRLCDKMMRVILICCSFRMDLLLTCKQFWNHVAQYWCMKRLQRMELALYRADIRRSFVNPLIQVGKPPCCLDRVLRGKSIYDFMSSTPNRSTHRLSYCVSSNSSPPIVLPSKLMAHFTSLLCENFSDCAGSLSRACIQMIETILRFCSQRQKQQSLVETGDACSYWVIDNILDAKNAKALEMFHAVYPEEDIGRALLYMCLTVFMRKSDILSTISRVVMLYRIYYFSGGTEGLINGDMINRSFVKLLYSRRGHAGALDFLKLIQHYTKHATSKEKLVFWDKKLHDHKRQSLLLEFLEYHITRPGIDSTESPVEILTLLFADIPQVARRCTTIARVVNVSNTCLVEILELLITHGTKPETIVRELFRRHFCEVDDDVIAFLRRYTVPENMLFVKAFNVAVSASTIIGGNILKLSHIAAEEARASGVAFYPLHHLVENDVHMACFIEKFVDELGFDFTEKDAHGRTPYDIAVARGHGMCSVTLQNFIDARRIWTPDIGSS